MKNGTKTKGFSWAKIDALAISEENIAKQTYPEQEIFFLRMNGDRNPYSSHGPFFLPDIKDLLLSIDSWNQISIRPLKEDYWIPLGEHPLFDRRKEQNQKDIENLAPDKKNIYIDKRGQKQGPFDLNEIQKKLNLGELCPTDLVGLEEGTRWIKLFDLHGLDRRNLNQKKLPDLPTWNVFKNSNNEVSNLVPKNDNNANPMALLAYFERIKSGKISPAQDLNEKSQMEKIKNEDKIFGIHWFLLSALTISLGGLLIGLFFYLSARKTPTNISTSISSDKKLKPQIRPISSYRKNREQINQSSFDSKNKLQKTGHSTLSRASRPTKSKTFPKRLNKNKKQISLRQASDETSYNSDYGTVDNPIELEPVLDDRLIEDEESSDGSVDSKQRKYLKKPIPRTRPAFRDPSSILEELEEEANSIRVEDELNNEYFDEEVEL